MAWNGTGTYVLNPSYSPEVNGSTIDAVRYNGLTTDIATAITNCIAKDGQNIAIANLGMGGFKHTGAAVANASGQYLTWGQNAQVGTYTFPLGAAATPSITFVGDPDTGMWSPAADTIAWSTAGSEKMRLESGGRLRSTVTTASSFVPGIILEGSGDFAGNHSPALSFSTSNLNAAIWSVRYVSYGGDLVFGTQSTAGAGDPVERMRITATGVIQDAAGLELGFKGLPAASITTGAFSAADRGKCVFATAGVTIPNATMSQGDIVTIQNTTGAAITITKTVTTAYNCNTGAALGATFSLGPRGRISILFESGTICDVSGNI